MGGKDVINLSLSLPLCPGVRCVLVETRHPGHATELVAALPMHELELYDGFLAVSCSLLLVQPPCSADL